MLSFIISPVAGISGLTDGINLINENDARRSLVRLPEQISYTTGSHTHEHLHKIRTGKRIEGHIGLSCHSLGKQSFTGSRRSYQKGSLRKLRTDRSVFCGIMQEVNDFHKAFLRLILTCHILKADAGVLLHIHLRLGLSYSRESSPGGSHLLHHGVHQNNQENKGQYNADNNLHQKGGIIRSLSVNLHIVSIETLHQRCRIRIDRHNIVDSAFSLSQSGRAVGSCIISPLQMIL